MEVLYERCCGLDVHKKTVVACVMITSPNGRVQKSVRTFGTTTADILDLRDWIDNQQISHLALEGNVYLRATLAEVSWCLSRMKDNYLSSQYHHFTRRMVKPKAIVACFHSVAVIAYHVLTKRKPYQDLGPTYLDSLTGERMAKQALRRLDALGYDVSITPKEVQA